MSTNQEIEKPKLRVTPERLVPLRALLPWFVLGFAAVVAAPLILFRATSALAEGIYRHPAILGAFHVFVLGWGTSIALGALQQLAPVLFGTVLYSERLARFSFGLYITGLLSLILGLLRWNGLLPFGALILPLGVMLAGMNVLLTQRQGQATSQGGDVRPFVHAALGYLGLAVVAGGMLAINFATGWLGGSWSTVFSLHIVWAVVGWFATLVIGVSYHMLPFFGLIEKKVVPRWRSFVRFLLQGAVITLVTAIVTAQMGWSIAPFFHVAALVCIVGACGGFLWDSKRLFARRDRARMHLTVTYIRAAHMYLLIAALMLPLLWMGGGNRGKGYIIVGLLAAGGWLSNTIVGYLHRILPFVVWHNKYWGRARERGVPAFRDMVSSRFAWLGFWLYNASIILAIAGVAGAVPVGFGIVVWVIGSALPILVLLQVLFR